MAEATLLGLDGEVVAVIQINHPTVLIQRPVAQPLTLEQLKSLDPDQGVDEDDEIPPLPGDFDDPRLRLPEITFERYQLVSSDDDRHVYRRIV